LDSKPKLVSQSGLVALSTLITGAFSYILLFVVARALNEDSAAQFLTLWALANTVSLSISLPADTYAPRFKLECEQLGIPREIRRLYLLCYGVCVGLVLFVVSVCCGIVAGETGLTTGLSVGFFAFSVAFFSGQRSYLMSEGQFASFGVQCLVSASLSVGLLLLAWITGRSTPELFFVSAAIGNFCSVLLTHPNLGTDIRRTNLLAKNWVLLKGLNLSGVLKHLYFSTLVALFLSNGTLIFAKLIGARDGAIISYAAAVNLTLVACFLLNTFTGPLHNRFVLLISAKEIEKVWFLYKRSIVLYLLFVIALGVTSFFLLPYLVSFYAGTGYEIGRFSCLMIVIGEGLATTLALPRALSVAIGMKGRKNLSWLVGAVGFACVLSLPISSLSRMLWAPIIASSIILTTLSFQIKRHMVRAISDPNL
jgi:O-antigen/teichoic acid export membrane protein